MQCGAMDGGHHSISGCPAIRKLVIERHNAAARHIMKAVADGQLGGALIMADVGNAEKMAEAGFHTKPAARIPETVLPGIDAVTRNSLKPDGLLVSNITQPIPQRKVHIIEIKYAADTNTNKQETRAQEQHNNLENILQAAGYSPNHLFQNTLVIGVGGTRYTENLTTLTALGVSESQAEKTLTKIHLTSVQWLHKIYCFKLHCNNQNIYRRGIG